MLVTTDAAKFKADSYTGVGISASLGNGAGGRAVTPGHTHRMTIVTPHPRMGEVTSHLRGTFLEWGSWHLDTTLSKRLKTKLHYNYSVTVMFCSLEQLKLK